MVIFITSNSAFYFIFILPFYPRSPLLKGNGMSTAGSWSELILSLCIALLMKDQWQMWASGWKCPNCLIIYSQFYKGSLGCIENFWISYFHHFLCMNKCWCRLLMIRVDIIYTILNCERWACSNYLIMQLVKRIHSSTNSERKLSHKDWEV